MSTASNDDDVMRIMPRRTLDHFMGNHGAHSTRDLIGFRCQVTNGWRRRLLSKLQKSQMNEWVDECKRREEQQPESVGNTHNSTYSGPFAKTYLWPKGR